MVHDLESGAPCPGQLSGTLTPWTRCLSARLRRSPLRRLGQPAATGSDDYLLEENGFFAQRSDPDGSASRTISAAAWRERQGPRPPSLAGIAGIVTPDTILRWYRTLVRRIRWLARATSWSPEHQGGLARW